MVESLSTRTSVNVTPKIEPYRQLDDQSDMRKMPRGGDTGLLDRAPSGHALLTILISLEKCVVAERLS